MGYDSALVAVLASAPPSSARGRCCHQLMDHGVLFGLILRRSDREGKEVVVRNDRASPR